MEQEGNSWFFSVRNGLRVRRTPYLYITGGDPILHPDFWKLCDLLKEKYIEFTIMGNPFHLTDEVYRRLKESVCKRYQRKTLTKYRILLTQ